jgi:hypothetical protein
MKPFKNRLFSVLLGMILIIFTIIAAEASLQIAAKIWVKADVLTRQDCSVVYDAEGSVSGGTPSCLDHDRRGYRNRVALNRAYIVTLGDSFTYGTEAADTAWPRILSHQLKKPVYNMALEGSAGPLVNLQHLPQALELHPRVVIYGFYFGNDLFDDFEYAKMHHMLANYVGQNVIADINKAEQSQTLVAKASVLFQSGLQGRPSSISKIKEFLATNSRLYQFLRSLKYDLFPPSLQTSFSEILEPRYEEAVAAILPSEKPYVEPFSENGWKTLFTSPYRLIGVNLSDVRIRTGLYIVEQSLLAMNQGCAEKKVHFIVALFPTKEFVFRPKVGDPSKYQSYEDEIKNEKAIKHQLLGFLKEHHIDFVDPTYLLENSANQPFFENANGHPNTIGHRLIAAAIEEHLKAHDYLAR